MVDGRLRPPRPTAEAPRSPSRDPRGEPDTAAGRPYFADWVLDQVAGYVRYSDADVVVTTTLDPELQTPAERRRRRLTGAEGTKRRAGQAALVALIADGAVRAMVGGRDYAREPVQPRHPGAAPARLAVQAFVFLAALEAGYDAGHAGGRRSRSQIDGWQPENSDGRFQRRRSPLREAFAQSINTVAVQLLERVGVAAGHRPGAAVWASPRRSAADPSLALGTSGVTLLEMTGAYAAVAADRGSVEPFAVRRSSGGRRRVPSTRRGCRAADAPPAWPCQQAMLDLLLAVVRDGTGKAARAYDRTAAGKTGTTQDYRDAWFVGFTADASWACGSATTTTQPMKRGHRRRPAGRDLARLHARRRQPQGGTGGRGRSPLRGPAQVVDTATLRVGGATVRLAGMTGAGGPQAARLRAALDGREVACDPAEGGAYRCMLGSEIARVGPPRGRLCPRGSRRPAAAARRRAPGAGRPAGSLGSLRLSGIILASPGSRRWAVPARRGSSIEQPGSSHADRAYSRHPSRAAPAPRSRPSPWRSPARPQCRPQPRPSSPSR